MNKGIRHGLIATLLLVSTGAQAAMSATELALVQADAWRVRMGFHLLSIRGDNPEDRVALKALLADGEQHVDALKAQAAPGEKDTATQLMRPGKHSAHAPWIIRWPHWAMRITAP